MREIAPEHGRDLGITADATTGDWGPEQGREFDVRFHGIRLDIPDEAREKLGERGVEGELQFIVEDHLEGFISDLKDKYKWVGEVGLVGRGPGWLVVGDKSFGEESTEDDWDAVHKMVELAMGALVAQINDPATWEEILAAREESRTRRGAALVERTAPAHAAVQEALKKLSDALGFAQRDAKDLEAALRSSGLPVDDGILVQFKNRLRQASGDLETVEADIADAEKDVRRDKAAGLR